MNRSTSGICIPLSKPCCLEFSLSPNRNYFSLLVDWKTHLRNESKIDILITAQLYDLCGLPRLGARKGGTGTELSTYIRFPFILSRFSRGNPSFPLVGMPTFSLNPLVAIYIFRSSFPWNQLPEVNLVGNRTRNFMRNPNLSISGSSDHPSRSCGDIYPQGNENWRFRHWREEGGGESFPPPFSHFDRTLHPVLVTGSLINGWKFAAPTNCEGWDTGPAQVPVLN